MNNDLFQQARQAFGARNYDEAARLFRALLDDPTDPLEPGEIGLVYHQMGNCYTKLKSYYEAIESYSHAAADTSYDACGTVNANMGMAYAALREWDGAVKHFEIAVSDRSYPTPYKAYQGMGNALLKQGKSAEAGVAFREAALDESNPDPTKALLNLGVCFMALNRPSDAVASYESALQFDMSADMRNKMQASLGQAYVASGQMQPAVDAFERALADKTYFLSDSASVDYQRAVAAVSQGTSEMTAVLAPVADTSGLEVLASGGQMNPAPNESAPIQPVDEEAAQASDYYFADEFEKSGDPAQAQERFFSASDEELEKWSRGVVKLERKRKSVGLKILIAILVIILIAVLAVGALYVLGFGFPQQQDAVVEDLFANPSNTEVYAPDVTEEEIQSFTEIIPEGTEVSVDGVVKSMKESTVYVTATLPEGAKVTYEVLLERGSNFVSWKVADVGLYFASTDENAVAAGTDGNAESDQTDDDASAGDASANDAAAGDASANDEAADGSGGTAAAGDDAAAGGADGADQADAQDAAAHTQTAEADAAADAQAANEGDQAA